VTSGQSAKNSVPLILITGKNGQVGWELQRSLSSLGRVVALGREQIDLSNSAEIRKTIRLYKPDIIVNAAAYTAVDKAESEAVSAMDINGIAPRVMAEEAKKIGAILVHYSTDYVYDGKKDAAYVESDRTNPLNEYGKTKLAGERNIQASGVDHIILRTSWVYASRGKNFLDSMLRLASERDELNIIADQVGSPTTARFIADVSAHVIKQTIVERKNGSFDSGLYNLIASGEISWHGFAVKIVELARELLNHKKISVKTINPITTEEYPVAAQRPLNSRLSTEKLTTHFSLHMQGWEDLLKLCIKELK
jgi:dTDP-4-dehydrorhamnose reductase